MIVLGIDTALAACSAAILKGGAAAGDKFRAMEKGHAEQLAPLVSSLFAETGLGAGDLDRIGVVIGPGGFAGVRVGLAFAHGLAIGTKAALVGVTSLEALAAGAEAGAMLRAPVIDARRGQVYAALYDAAGGVRLAPFVAAPEEALSRLVHAAGGAAALLLGSGALLLPGAPAGWTVGDSAAAIDPKVVARLAAGAPAPSGPPAPLYLRPPDAAPAGPSPFAGLFVEDGR